MYFNGGKYETCVATRICPTCLSSVSPFSSWTFQWQEFKFHESNFNHCRKFLRLFFFFEKSVAINFQLSSFRRVSTHVGENFCGICTVLFRNFNLLVVNFTSIITNLKQTFYNYLTANFPFKNSKFSLSVQTRKIFFVQMSRNHSPRLSTCKNPRKNNKRCIVKCFPNNPRLIGTFYHNHIDRIEKNVSFIGN